MVYMRMDIPQEVKVDGGKLGLNQSPETPEEMRCLDTEEEEENNTETQRISMYSLSKSKCRF